MLILITNDDGFESKGIKALKAIAKILFPNSQIVIFAPMNNQSCKSASITSVGSTVKTIKNNEEEYIVYGTPADCILAAVQALDKKPDLVLSGINVGSNLGDDQIWSGTIGAAMVASVFFGIKSIAISQQLSSDFSCNPNLHSNEIDWSFAITNLTEILRELITNQKIWNNIYIYSINIPIAGKYTPKAKITQGCSVRYKFNQESDSKGKVNQNREYNDYSFMVSLKKEIDPSYLMDINYDCGALRRNYISVSPIFHNSLLSSNDKRFNKDDFNSNILIY